MRGRGPDDIFRIPTEGIETEGIEPGPEAMPRATLIRRPDRLTNMVRHHIYLTNMVRHHI